MFQNCKISGVNVCSKEYHALKNGKERGTPEFVMSPSSLNLFAHLPSKWRKGWSPPDSKAKRWGNIADCLALTPDKFLERYAIEPQGYPEVGMKCPKCGSITDSKKCAKCKCDREKCVTVKPWRYGTAFTDAWLDAQINSGREAISMQEAADANAACKRLLEPTNGDDTVARWFEASEKQVLVTGEWKDDATGLVVPVSCLIDFVPRGGTEFDSCAGDSKTAICAHPQVFEETAFKYGYHIQGAWCMAMLNAATKQERNTWCFIVQESFEPWEPMHSFYGDADASGMPTFLEMGRKAEFGGYEGLMALYCQCVKHDTWPGYNSVGETAQGWAVLRPRKLWMTERAERIAKFAKQAEMIGAPEEEDGPMAESDSEVVP